MLKLACLLLDPLLVFHMQRFGEQALGQAVTPNDIGGALLAARSEIHDAAAVLRSGIAVRRMNHFMAAVQDVAMLVRL